MPLPRTALALLALLHAASAHYYFPHLIVNGSITPEFKYVRHAHPPPPHNHPLIPPRDVRPAEGDYSNPNGYTGKEYPVYGDFENTYMTDVRCGRDAFAFGASKTETATVSAGSEVGFAIKEFGDAKYNNGVFHPGPAQVYMSASADPAADPGDGEWFKIYYLGPESNTTWATDRATQVRVMFLFSLDNRSPLVPVY